jgi:anti-sigma-K factor RskA
VLVVKLDTADERSAAAGEYVLGTLSAAERREVEQALAHDAALQAEVYAWQDRLLPLAVRVPPATIDPADWRQLESRLGPQGAVAGATPAADAGNDPLWRRLRRWQITGVAGMAASLVLAALLVLRGPAAPGERYLALLQAPTDNATGWLVEITAGQQLRLVPVGAAAPLPPGRALQFWTKPEGAAGPTSLGLVEPGRVTTLPVSALPAVGTQQLFELTLEPATGSPIGRPTGPILFVGKTLRL